MNLFDAIAKRHSVRTYLDKPVEPEKLQSIFSAVRLAPSARNGQEWRFIAVTDPELRERVAAAGGQPFLSQCPVIVAACAETDRRVMRCGEMAYPIDVAIAIDHLTLAAAAMGLGTCWVGSFDPQIVREALGIPENAPVVELIALGYSAEEDKPAADKARLKMSEIFWENSWNNPFLR
ncbi:nitroreductase family protein [Breznakiella homolactica]|uniref:Nitroreductase family protein n=2 Tax=Breznakiella homolactica TaxID=2798577 RepID=A0A7T7XS50_9SPIR|nr:nitroreductase family protein [Breznakiella homolactica]